MTSSARPRIAIAPFDRGAPGDDSSADIFLDGACVGMIVRSMRDWNSAGASRSRVYGVDHYSVEFTGAAPLGDDRVFRPGVDDDGPRRRRREKPTQEEVAAALSAAKAYAREQLAARTAKPNGPRGAFGKYRALPVDADAGNPLAKWGAQHAWGMGSSWTVSVMVPLAELESLRPVMQSAARLASVRNARKAGVPLPPIELGVFRDDGAWIIDGNHRLKDARRAGLDAIAVRFTFVGT